MAMTHRKFEARCDATGNRRSMYAMLSYRRHRHHERLKAFIDRMPRKLVCQDCGGAGGETEKILDDGTGPWFECGWCGGIGYVTPWVRGRYLRLARAEKAGATCRS